MLKWLNIIGMVLQFISFWCAAPELIGQSTLKQMEKGMIRFVARLPAFMVFGGMLAYALAAGLFGVHEGMTAARGGEPLLNMSTYFLLLGVAMILYFLFVVFYKRILFFLERHLAQPLVHSLVADGDVRRKALILGAILLTSGFILQFIAAVLA
jgi:hypothetical protein